ncbi:MAG TPA: biotin/lipoyl-containing protein, partial [Candidatus Nanopelagicales bacterium]|nr:biotin/lipoyl-containing protein [Candidatus Nanopelagicales bacterium]
LVSGARHVEVQVIADGQGTAWALGVRDCSVQRRNQKVIEESASPVLTDAQAAELKTSAERLALAVDYRGAATVEFLYHPQEKIFAFLEVNTRLQVEHPITEVTTDLDLVKAQLHIAAGGRLTGPRPAEVGHAVEARLNAEDPDRDFAPSPGRIAMLRLPSGPGVRVDTGVSEGDTIPADFDSMIAKIIAYGRNRDEALARLRCAVAGTTVLIEGGSTNKSFLLDLLDQPAVIEGSADTGWIDRVRAEGGLVVQEHSGVALVAAAVAAYRAEAAVERTRLLETAHGGRPQVQHEVGRSIELKLRGATYRVTVAQVGPNRFRVAVDDGATTHVVEADLEMFDAFTGRLTVAGHRYRLLLGTHGPVNLVEIDGITHRINRDEGGIVRSPAPALVVATPVAVGTEVEAGAAVLVLESMKMETVLAAPFAGRVRELLVAAGSQVETGAPLLRLEPTGDADSAAAADDAAAPVYFPAAPANGTPRDRAARRLDDLRSLLLGYDVDPHEQGGGATTSYLRARGELADAGELPLAAEIDTLQMFADLAELSRNKPVEGERTEDRVHSPREHFHTYLQSLDPERGALPDSFRARLQRVLAHYGVVELDRTPELEGALFRIFLAQQRSAADVPVVTALLTAWLAGPPPEAALEEPARQVLDHLVQATQLRLPVVGDLARSVRFRWFDEPVVQAVRAEALAGVHEDILALADNPDAPDREERIDALAALPEQIVGFLAERMRAGIPAHEPMLEVLTRRHYQGYELHDLRAEPRHGRPFVVAGYTLDDRPTQVVTTLGNFAELTAGDGLVDAIQSALDERTAGDQAVVDLYLEWPDAPESLQETSDVLGR